MPPKVGRRPAPLYVHQLSNLSRRYSVLQLRSHEGVDELGEMLGLLIHRRGLVTEHRTRKEGVKVLDERHDVSCDHQLLLAAYPIGIELSRLASQRHLLEPA